MKTLIFLFLGIILAIAGCCCQDEKMLSSLDEQKLRLHEKYATFNGTELENLGKRTFFWALGTSGGPELLMTDLNYANFDYKKFSEAATEEEMWNRMMNDLKYANDDGLMFASYGKLYQTYAKGYYKPLF